jgi:hypothetical protein
LTSSTFPVTVIVGAVAAGGITAGVSLAQMDVEAKIMQIANKAFIVLTLLLN